MEFSISPLTHPPRAHRFGVFQTESNRIEFQYLRNCGSWDIKHKMNFVLPIHGHHTQVLVALSLLYGGSYLGLKFYRIGKIWLFDEPYPGALQNGLLGLKFGMDHHRDCTL